MQNVFSIRVLALTFDDPGVVESDAFSRIQSMGLPYISFWWVNDFLRVGLLKMSDEYLDLWNRALRERSDIRLISPVIFPEKSIK